MTVTLQFQSLEILTRFRLQINAINFELNVQQLTLTCNCSEEEIEKARMQFGAIVFFPGVPSGKSKSRYNQEM